MKKSGAFVKTTLSLLTSGMFLSFASALPTSSQEIIDSMTQTLGPIFQALFGDYGSTDFLFTKVLLFFMLIIIINASLKKMDLFAGKQGVITILSIAIPILSIRYLQDNDLISGILLPYGTLGIALVTILPLIIFFGFIHFTNMGGFGRRMSWVFFMIIFGVLWNSRYAEIGDIGNKIYWWSAVVIIILFILDKNIHHYFRTWELSTFYKKANQRTIAMLQAEYLHIGEVNTEAAIARRTEIKKQLTSLGADLP
ncbi:hypothetical protein KA107_01490 [Candidatus Pacearchaeota archaeon]|nr:hypothetical protein [Candidatus Pacearchaeota archaeon]